MPSRIVILGAGHAGLRCANALAQRLAPKDEIVVVARDNYFLYYPFLRDLVAGAADLMEVAFPLREVLHPRVHVVVGELASVDAAAGEARVRLKDREVVSLPFDQLVVALGSTTSFHHAEGAAENALPFKSVDDALRLRLRVLDALETAEAGGTAPVDVVVSGGGYTGLEVAGALHDLLRRAHRVYGRALRERPPRIHVVESEDKLVPEMPRPIPRYAERVLSLRGDSVHLGKKVERVEPHAAILDDGTRLDAAAVVWSAGVRATPALDALPFEKDEHGRLRVDVMLRARERVWAIGDCAGHAPMTAQSAEAEASSVASNLVRSILGRPLRPYFHRARGLIVPLGEGLGVAQMGKGDVVTGRAAGLMWRAFHLARLPGAARKARYLAGWMTGAAKQRALVRAPAFSARPSSRRPS